MAYYEEREHADLFCSDTDCTELPEYGCFSDRSKRYRSVEEQNRIDAQQDERIAKLEQNQGGLSDEEIQRAVSRYMAENPFDFTAGNGIVIEGDTISVQTTDAAEQDNTLPITSSGVYVIVGNIEALLRIL